MPIEPIRLNSKFYFSFLGKPCLLAPTFLSVLLSLSLSDYTVITFLDLVCTEWQTPGHTGYNITVVIFEQKFRWEWNPLGL